MVTLKKASDTSMKFPKKFNIYLSRSFLFRSEFIYVLQHAHPSATFPKLLFETHRNLKQIEVALFSIGFRWKNKFLIIFRCQQDGEKAKIWSTADNRCC